MKSQLQFKCMQSSVVQDLRLPWRGMALQTSGKVLSLPETHSEIHPSENLLPQDTKYTG